MHPKITDNIDIPEADGLVIAANKDRKVSFMDGRVVVQFEIKVFF